jgi:hypothetical protein
MVFLNRHVANGRPRREGKLCACVLVGDFLVALSHIFSFTLGAHTGPEVG